jgi:allantoin racemase
VRIWHQSMTELETLPDYAAALATRYAAVVEPSTEVVLHGMPVGTYGSSSPAHVLSFPTELQRVGGLLVRLAQQAEREEFDAVMVASFAEPNTRAVRSAVDMPVVSMAESSLLAACSVADRFGIVTITPDVVQMLDGSVARQGLRERSAAIVSLSPAVNEFDLQRAWTHPDDLAAAFVAGARTVIDAGADVVIAGEGVLNELVVHLGITEVDGVAVMDSVAVTALHTEMLARAYARGSLRTGRRWSYPRVPDGLAHLLDTPRQVVDGEA